MKRVALFGSMLFLNVALVRAQGFTNVIGTVAGVVGVGGSLDGIGLGARFDTPRAVAVDGAGNVYVADQLNHTIRELTLTGTNWVSATIAGQAGVEGSVDGSGTNALFNNPAGVAVDGGGNVFVADEGNQTIRELTPGRLGWQTATIAGQAGNAGGADGTNGAARFNSPSGLAVDAGDDVYVADWGSHTIRELIPSGTNWGVVTIAGLAGNKGTSDGTNSVARFDHPEDVAVDAVGDVYVADWGNHAIREMTPAGTNWSVSTIAGVAGSTNYGSADGVGGAAQFYYPSGLALDNAGNIYVADTFNDTIREMTLVGGNWNVSTVAGAAGMAGSADGLGTGARFYNPCGVAVDGSDNLFVADTGNQTIRGPSAPVITLQPQSQIIPVGSNAVFSVSLFGTLPLSYQWLKNGTNIAGATNQTFTITNIQAGDTALYSAVISNPYGSATSLNAQLTVIPPPGIYFFEEFTNVDFTAAGCGGMRGNGVGAITLTNVSGTVKQALLYWHGPGDSIDTTANATVNFAGTSVTGVSIGFSSDNSWGFNNSQAYRADVTSLVTGNGTYALTNFYKGSAADVNGASLIVFFDDGNPNNNRDVYVYNGNDSNLGSVYDPPDWFLAMTNLVYASNTNVSLTLHVSDGQTFPDDQIDLNGAQLIAPGTNFSGDSVPPYVTNGLWDIKTYDVTSFLSGGTNSLILTSILNQDYLSLVAATLSFPASGSTNASAIEGPILNSANGHTYYVVPKGSWTQAQTEAQALGGNLVTIRSAAENGWIVTNLLVDLSGTGGPNLSNLPLWIGLYDPSQDSGGGHATNFVWVDGEPVTYTNWNAATGEPSDTGGDEFYAAINWHFAQGGSLDHGVWNDTPLNGTTGYGGTSDGPYYGIIEVVGSGTTNLLLNPGAETGTLTNWTDGGSSNPFAGSPANSLGDGFTTHSGNYYFVGGTGTYGSLSQVVSLVGNQGVTAVMIDNSNLAASVSFWEQGLNQGTPSDDASITLTFLGASSNVLTTVNTPVIDSHNSTWSNYVNQYAIPAGTRFIEYTMNFYLNQGAELDAFIDDNYLSVVQPLSTVASSPTISGPSVYGNLVAATPNLLGYWPFSAASQANSSVNGYTGTFIGNAAIGPAGSGPALVNGLDNTAVVLDGTNSYVDTTLVGGLSTTGTNANQGSIVAWFKLTALPSNIGHFFSIAGESQNGNDFDLQIETDNELKFYTDNGSATVDTTAFTTNDLNVWHFAAATFTGGASRNLYLDGQLVASSTPGSHNPATGGTFAMGYSDAFSGRYFSGSLDEIAVFNRQLTGSEVTNLYSAAVLPAFSSPAQNVTVTNGDPFSFTITASGSTPLFYQWQKNGINLADGGNISGSGTNTLNSSVTSTNDDGSYFVIITNAYGSVTSSVVNLTVIANIVPPSPVQIVAPQVSGGSFNLSFQSVNSQSYTLYYNDNLATANWLPYTNVTGNGGTLQLTVPITNSAQRFFRISEP